MQQLTETQKAYLAGLIDGEGCITIVSSRGRYFQLKLIIGGTIEEHIRACADMTGLGSVHHTVKRGNSADQWQWHLSASQAENVLRSVLPYLILKADQARLGLRFQEHMNNSPAYNNRHPMPRRVLAHRQEMANILKDMKNNGKVFENEEFENIALPTREWTQQALI